MSINNLDNIVEQLSLLPVQQIVELVAKLETKWGVSAAAAVAPSAAASVAAVEDLNAEYELLIQGYDNTKKAKVIMALKAVIAGSNLADLKTLVESSESDKKQLGDAKYSKENAMNVAKTLKEAGVKEVFWAGKAI